MADIPVKKPILATGRRKTSVAQVRFLEGEGKVLINSRTIEEYFGGRQGLTQMAKSPLNLIKDASYNVFVKVCGGGISSQAGAIRHGMARALARMSDTNKSVMKKAGFLTRDSRMVERKKPGKPKARKRFQFSKR